MFLRNASIAKVRTAMLVVHAGTLPRGEQWDYEYSWSGDRVLAVKDGASVRLSAVLHRRELTNRFPVIAAAVAKLKTPAVVLDGVIRTLEPSQYALFAAGSPSAASHSALRLIATDVLWLADTDVRPCPLRERKQMLRDLVSHTDVLFSAPLDAEALDMLQCARAYGADGVVAKRRQSRYRPFARNGDWVRVSVERLSDPESGSAENELVAAGHP